MLEAGPESDPKDSQRFFGESKVARFRQFDPLSRMEPLEALLVNTSGKVVVFPACVSTRRRDPQETSLGFGALKWWFP